jgi:hypothetical protein
MHPYLLYIFIENLPLELMEMIRRMTYKVKSKEMLNQLKNRHILKNLIYETYLPIYSHELPNDPKAIENWIDNDISLILNKENANMYGYVEEYYTILSRNIVFNTKEKIDSFSDSCFMKMDSKSTINIYIGLLIDLDINYLLRYIDKTYNTNIFVKYAQKKLKI